MKTIIYAFAVFALAALFAAPAAAQNAHQVDADPLTPASPVFQPGIVITYNLADIEADDPLQGFAAEVDLRFADTPISLVAHVNQTGDANFVGVGPRVTHDWGPFEIFGHYLFGNVTTDGVRNGASMRRGGGANVPIADGLFLRMGADHDGQDMFTVVGLGYDW